jgi:nucleoside-triphosphatase
LLAHVELAGPPRVGRYGVNLEAFEALALPAISWRSGEQRVFLVDELGKMELASEPFGAAVSVLFAEPVAVVATVQQKPHPFVTRLKRRSEVKTFQLTAATRERLPSEIAARLTRDRA